ncbi:MAG: hypothetical protein MRY49_02965 [Candidatus Pacebacteria bacterium]|nr:hypothetical protein [Candidatus Paceibacterota bacterium]
MTSGVAVDDFVKERLLTIVNGPGEFDVTISLMRGKRVKFQFEDQGSVWDKCPLIFCELTAFDRRQKVYKFRACFPKDPSKIFDPIGELVRGVYSLTTRRGILELTPDQLKEWEHFLAINTSTR